MIHKLMLVAGSVGAMVFALSACEVTVTDDAGEGGGNTGGTDPTGTGGTSSVGNGTGGMGTGGMGGMATECVSCVDALTACNMGSCLESPVYCDGSQMLFDATFSCACDMAVCGAECAKSCTGMGEDASTCVGCLQTAILQTDCKREGDACIMDE